MTYKRREDETETETILDENLKTFTKQLFSLKTFFPLSIDVMAQITKVSQDAIDTFAEKNCEVKKNKKNKKTQVKVPNHHISEWEKKLRTYEESRVVAELMPSSLIISMVSQYDVFLSSFIKDLIRENPLTLNHFEKRDYGFEKIVQFETINEFKEYVLDTEIEQILRKSRSDQIDTLEKMFKFTVKDKISSLSQFVELTERRNIFVHNNGYVNSAYINTCKRNKVEELPKPGEKLDASSLYINKSFDCLYEIGVKIAHSLWRKTYRNRLIEADKNLIYLSFELIQRGRYHLAINILSFYESEWGHKSQDEDRVFLLLNLAQAYKWSGDEDKTIETLNLIDWSAKETELKLGNAVLREEWGDAVKHMSAIDHRKRIDKTCYADWPIFKEFIKTKDFKKAYKDLFDEDFSQTTSDVSDKISDKHDIIIKNNE